MNNTENVDFDSEQNDALNTLDHEGSKSEQHVSLETREIFKRTRLKELRLKDFMSYENHTFDFTGENGIHPVYGFYGPNGTGKSTALEAVTLLFSNFTGYKDDRLKALLSKYVRKLTGDYLSNDNTFLVEGVFESDIGEYNVIVTRDGIVQGHPKEIADYLLHHVFLTSYDEELHTFQLREERWDIFKKLFEAVTGYRVEKREPEFKFGGQSLMNMRMLSDDEKSKKDMACLDTHVLGLTIHKPNETITERQCSDGEKKVLKNFTTLLNKDFIPSIILIDNVEMHVEIDRHIPLLEAIGELFPDSQVLFTTHSPRIVSNYPQERLYNLRAKERGERAIWQNDLEKIVRGSLTLCNVEVDDSVNPVFETIDSGNKQLALQQTVWLFEQSMKKTQELIVSVSNS
jgi:predicted ATPase